MRFPVPQGLSTWWDEGHLPEGPLHLALEWRGGARLAVGRLHCGLEALHFTPDPEDFTGDGPERVGRLVAKALTRAGWLRPRLDPAAMLRLVELRSAPVRIEFILDTNAMVEGVGHWLADHFADRCDLVVTAVSLREVQDNRERAGFGERLNDKKAKARGDILGPRQLYLAASRFREQTGYSRVLWRELELDDTALLLSRGAASAKSSESDTLLLRAVRRSIHDRVNKLERFFVTGDTALARRAATELPAASVIAARVRDVEQDEVVFPCAWWPGPDQGYRVPRHVSRLVWELLCIGDAVTLSTEEGRTWRFRAFDNPMWPSDYLDPWVNIEGPPEPSPAAGVAPLDDNLRVAGPRVLDVLAALVLSPGTEAIALPAEITSEEQRRHIPRLLAALDLADVDAQAWTARPRPRREELARAWHADDREALFDLLRAWTPLDEWATLDDPPTRPKRTQQAARSLAGLLGQGMHVEGRWLAGGRRPAVVEMREAVLDALARQPQKAIPVYTLLVDVFLRRLGMSPARVAGAWDDLWRAGVFEGLEPREGGSSSGTRVQEVAHFTGAGWQVVRIDMESCAGVRDLVDRRAA